MKNKPTIQIAFHLGRCGTSTVRILSGCQVDRYKENPLNEKRSHHSVDSRNHNVELLKSPVIVCDLP